jgi:hypothetical protein
MPPSEHMGRVLYETGHIPPANEFVEETLAWIDRNRGREIDKLEQSPRLG